MRFIPLGRHLHVSRLQYGSRRHPNVSRSPVTWRSEGVFGLSGLHLQDSGLQYGRRRHPNESRSPTTWRSEGLFGYVILWAWVGVRYNSNVEDLLLFGFRRPASLTQLDLFVKCHHLASTSGAPLVRVCRFLPRFRLCCVDGLAIVDRRR